MHDLISMVKGPVRQRSPLFRARLAALAAVAALLGSCGGGGGDSIVPAPTPRTVTLTAPVAFADGLDGTVQLAATADSGSGVVAVEFQVDGVAVGTEDTSAPYGTTIDATRWASGQHVVRARGRDAAGNRTAWSSAVVRFGGGRAVTPGFTKNEGWVTGLAGATSMTQAPDGRLFVAEQGGNLRIVKNGALLAQPFLSLTVDSSGERGLLGVALHPNFAANRLVYVYYTRVNGTVRNNRVSRFVANGDVVGGPEEVLLDLPNLSGATNHNGGALKFGPDRKLYLGVGDNANGLLAQDLSHPFGKLLRFNDDLTPAGDNPFFRSQAGLGRAVWAYGLRNPFTFAFQPETSRLHINDVGEQTWEEINLGAAGANYGWPNSEGPVNIGAGVTAPIFTYAHAPASPAGSGPGGFFTGQAIAGGAFYPTGNLPAGAFPAAYRGNYFFADFGSRFIGLLDIANDNAAYTFASVTGLPVDMMVGSDGALYVLTRSAITRISSP